jgi:hypothetical protein
MFFYVRIRDLHSREHPTPISRSDPAGSRFGKARVEASQHLGSAVEESPSNVASSACSETGRIPQRQL